MTDARPLDGITVISVEQAVAAPFATRQLADLGARVIKIERPGAGDLARGYDESVLGQSSYFVWLNRGKESLTLDIKTAAGADILRQLLVDADVFVQNLGPGAAARLGLDAPTLAELNRRLVVCDISGYGSTGDWSQRKAYDMLVQAEAGLLSLTGTPDSPSRVGVSIADIAAGMYAYSGILTALYQRETTGVVSPVQVALFEALVEWMSQPAYYTKYSGSAPARVGAEHATIAPYGPFAAADGATVLIAIQNEPEWRTFCRVVLDDQAISTDARFDRNSARVANRVALNQLISERFAALAYPALVALLEQARTANAQLRTMPEFLEHPSLNSRERWREVDSPGGPIQALLPPAELGGVLAQMGSIPALGEHTNRILSELQIDAESIAALRAAGTV
jgi:crotonobetainyl-CoA:carnitine CoA-transferase CaiB-like acyl-CoA transferase